MKHRAENHMTADQFVVARRAASNAVFFGLDRSSHRQTGRGANLYVRVQRIERSSAFRAFPSNDDVGGVIVLPKIGSTTHAREDDE